MAQTITDFQSFLKDAEEAVLELSDLTKKSAQLKQEEERLERVLQAENVFIKSGLHGKLVMLKS